MIIIFVETVESRRHSGDPERVLVKWANWKGPSTWVALALNQELRAFLEQNGSNPHSCTLFKDELGAKEDKDMSVLSQAIYDNLLEISYTPDGFMGRQVRVTVKVPFRKNCFDESFRPIIASKISKSGNIACLLTVENMDRVFGDTEWRNRTNKTSTETSISAREYIHLTWGIRNRTPITMQLANGESIQKVIRMQRPGTEANRTQIQPSKPKRETNKITNNQNTKRTYGQPSEQLFPKAGQCMQ